MQSKNKNRVEHDVRRRTHNNGQHADLRKALTVYVRIQSERRHHAQRAEQINRQIRRRIRIRRIARAEQIQQRSVKDETDRRQHRPSLLFGNQEGDSTKCYRPLPLFREGTEKHTIFILTLIKKKKSIRVFMILVDFLLDKI